MGRTTIFTQCGLRLRSELELNLPVADGDAWDVDVRMGPPIADSTAVPEGEIIAVYDDAHTRWYTATATDDGYLLRFREVGEFAVSSALDEVEVRPDPNGRVELLPILMAGTASAFLLALRGHTVLHASAVSIDGNAVAFVGQSGRGKSTVAAMLCVEGAQLVTDDVLVVDPGPPPSAVGGAAELRLRPAAVQIAEAHPDVAARTTADQRLAFAPRPAEPAALPLAAVVVPSPSRTEQQVRLRRVPAVEALQMLLSFPRVHGWRHSDVLSQEFSTIAKLVDAVGVHEAVIPWGPPFSPHVARELLGELAALHRG